MRKNTIIAALAGTVVGSAATILVPSGLTYWWLKRKGWIEAIKEGKEAYGSVQEAVEVTVSKLFSEDPENPEPVDWRIMMRHLHLVFEDPYSSGRLSRHFHDAFAGLINDEELLERINYLYTEATVGVEMDRLNEHVD